MRKIFFAFTTGILAITGLSSCSEKINVAAPYKDYTVVYGLMDMADTAHYIRIQKAFLDNDKSAIDMAKVVDSNFFAQIDVKIKVISSAGALINTITPIRVDLNAEGYTKDDGTFFTSPSYAYKFKDALDPANTYRLVITHTTGEVDSSETAIIDETGGPGGNTSAPFYIYFFDYDANATLDFKDTNVYSIFNMTGRVPSTVAIVTGTMRIHWTNDNGSSVTADSADWDFADAVANGNSFTLSTKNTNLYAFMYTAIGPAPAGVSRHIGSVDVMIYAATADFSQYATISAAQNIGITGDEIKPNFTNIKGANTLGLFTSRGKRIATGRHFTPQTYNSFVNSATLAALNIKLP